MISSDDYLIDDFLSSNTAFVRGENFSGTIESVERFIIHEVAQPLSIMAIEVPDELQSDVDKLSREYSNLRANRRTNHFVSKSLINNFIIDVKRLYLKSVDYDSDNFFKKDVKQLLTIVNYFDVFKPKLIPFSVLFDDYIKNIGSFNSDNLIKVNNSSLSDYNLMIDVSKFNFLLLNLGKNSINAINARFNDCSGGLIDVSVNESGGFFVLKHYDNGCGMSAELAAKLFKTSCSTNPDSDMHGLGALIIKEIVTSHNGSISVKSDFNYGTEINVFLPVAYK